MATRYIQTPEAFVVTGIGTTETQVTLSNFKTISGDLITQSMIGGVSDYIPMTLSPRTEREEQVLAKVNSVSDQNVILDIIRAVNPVSPYNTGGGVAKAHNVNDTAVISNNPALFNKLTAKDNNETVTADWTFDGDNTHNGEETFTDTVDVTGGVLKVADAVADNEPYTKLQTDTALALKANASATVNLTGDQTVAGVKTFSSPPVVPTAVNPTDAINKSQVEAFVAANSGDILASDTAFGTVKLDVAADDVAEPLALSATEDRVDALAGGGDLGTPSASNKFLTEDGFDAKTFSIVSTSNSGTFTRTTNTGGTQTIAHGLGVVPNYVKIMATTEGQTGTRSSIGEWHAGGGSLCWWHEENEGGSSSDTNYADIVTSFVVRLSSTASSSRWSTATIAVDATNITLTWTSTTSNTTEFKCGWLAKADSISIT